MSIYSNSPNDQEAFTEETQENFKEHVDGGIWAYSRGIYTDFDQKGASRGIAVNFDHITFQQGHYTLWNHLFVRYFGRLWHFE